MFAINLSISHLQKIPGNKSISACISQNNQKGVGHSDCKEGCHTHNFFLSSDNTTHNESKIKGKIVLATDFCLQDISMTKGFKNVCMCTCIQSCNKLQNNKLKFKQEKSRQVFKFFFLPKKIVLQLIAIYCND